MKACSRIIFREYTRWNWHRFIKMVAVASKGQSLRHSWWKPYVIQSTKPIEWIVLFMRRKVNRVLRTAVGDTALLPCRKDLCDGEMPAALRQILWAEWALFGMYACQVQDIPGMMTGAWMEETALPPVTHLPITTFLFIRFSIFLLHRFASNAIIY